MLLTRHSSGHRRFYRLGLACILSGALLWPATLAVNRSKADETASPRPDLVVAPGLVEPVSGEISISNLIQGTIRRMPVAEGDHVTSGQVLAELVNDDLDAAVSAARAQLDLAGSQLEKLMNGARMEERREADANLRDAAAVLSMAEVTLQRRGSLVATHAATVESFDQARASAQSDRARRDALAEKLALINAPPRPEDVSIARANVQFAEARLQQAKAMLEKSFVRAPFDGTVLRTLRHEGEQVSETFPSVLIVMGNVGRLRVRSEIDETDVGRVKLGQRAYATVDAYRGRRFSGTITEIASRMGKKAVHTNDPAEKIDAKVLDALMTLDTGVSLPVGLRVDVFMEAASPDGWATAPLGQSLFQRQ